MPIRFNCRKYFIGVVLFAAMAALSARAESPLASVHYFNAYQDPTNWGGWGSSIYQGDGAYVVNVTNTVPVATVAGQPAMVLNAVNPPGAYWNVLFKVSGNALNWLRTGTNPALHLRLLWSAIPSNGQWNMNVVMLGGSINASVSLNHYITASTNRWQDIYISGSAFLANAPSVDLTHVWQVALQAAGNYTDHCILNIAALDVVPSATDTNYAELAKVDQLGYAPLESPKIGLITWETNAIAEPPSTFEIVNSANDQVVLTGPVTQFIQPDIWQASGWDLSGDVEYQADFTAVRAPGTYTLQLPQQGAVSQPFVIATNVYQKIFRDALRYFYFSRATYPIVNPYAEGAIRAAVHPETTNASYNYNPADGNYNFGANATRDVHGSWFDAGDTHVDVPNTAVACWFLLETARDFGSNVPPYWLDLPESTSGQGDLIPLIENALDWMQRMQNTNGSVCHYVLGNPNTAAQVQQVSDVSSFATACAAGTFAKAYTVLGPSLPASESSNLLACAELAWSWLTNHPAMAQPRLPLVNGQDPGGWDTSWGGATFDTQCRAYAAVELFAATGQSAYNSFFMTQYRSNSSSPLDGSIWGDNTTGFGSDDVITYLNNVLDFAFMDYARETTGGNQTVKSELQSAFQHQADLLTNYTALSDYRVPMLYPDHLYWGSSGGVLAPAGMVLARAWQWTGDVAYHDTALQALHFICGRNPVNRIFSSGYGDYQHGSDFYSTFWTNLLAQPPGYIGANINVAGSAVADVTYPWKRMIDTQDADMTEPGVYWNSAVAWLAGYVNNDATPPNLQAIPRPGGQLLIQWPIRSATFQLYQTTNLANPNSWSLVSATPAQTNTLWQVTLTPGAGETFYRLKSE